jgi:hypothetical protein
MMGPSGHVQAHAQPALGTGMAETVSLDIHSPSYRTPSRKRLRREVGGRRAGRGLLTPRPF